MNSVVTPLLSVESVRKTYARDEAVKQLTFQVRRGEIFALLGPNGAGKTTVVRMIVGITRPDRGTVHFHFENRMTHRPRPEDLGYLPEERGLYRSAPILRTLIYFAILRGMSRVDARVAAREWLARFDLLDRADEKLETLSRGNQQKVQFISAVLHRPRLVVLDEPFSGLDPLNQELFLDVVRELRDAGSTILLSAHQMNLVEKIADRVLLIDDGTEVLSGTLPELRARGHGGNRLVLRVASREGMDVLQAHPDVQRVAPAPGGAIALWLRKGAAMSSVLVAAGTRFEVSGVHSEEMSLHDIFVGALGDAAGPGPGPDKGDDDDDL